MQTTLDFDRVFRALADATRRDIVRRAIAGEEGVAELAEPDPAWVPEVRVERIPQASHWVQADAPERVNQLMVEFLQPIGG